jgi:hypothetical protein
MDERFDGKIALVAGGYGAIGAAIAPGSPDAARQ